MDGRRLVQLRERAGLTQVQLAVAADLSLTTISDIERGAPINPRYTTLQALATALDVEVADVLAAPDAPAPPEPAKAAS